jgi:hypothetical protein
VDGSLSTALILGAVAMSEGIRVTPSGAVVMHRLLAGPWKHVEPLALGRGFTLPSVASPFTVAVVVSPVVADTDPRAQVTVLHERMAATRTLVTWLRLLGAVSATTLVVGVPWLTARAGWFGLVASLTALLALAVVQAWLIRHALRRLGSAKSIATAVRVLWPFTTPRSAELVLDAAVAGIPPLVAARALLREGEFRRTVRSLAYDVVHQRDAPEGDSLRALCDPDELRAIIADRPEESERYCPRCAAGYAPGIRECAECLTVPLVGA